MVRSNLGRLSQIELRSIWTDEARDFTPWLAQQDNLKLLGEAIGIELELEAQERAVGPFSADILCKDTAAGSWVLIENQLERTDHTHLGQLITYSAGLQAVTVVWISSHLTEEHRAALDWLNEITADKFRFFGLEIQVWRIGDSATAPKFNIVSEPNDWVRDVARSTAQLNRSELSDNKKLQVDFWTAFRIYADEHETLFRSVKPRPQNWLSMGIGRNGFHLSAVASFWDSAKENWQSHELRVEMVVDGINAKAHYDGLESQREEIDGALQSKLTWRNSSDARMCRIYARKEVDLDDRTRWPEYLGWLVDELNGFYRLFSPIVRNLEP